MGTAKYQYLRLFFPGVVHFFPEKCLYFLLESRTGLRGSVSEQQERPGGWGGETHFRFTVSFQEDVSLSL